VEAIELLALLLQQPVSQQAYFRRGPIRDSAQDLLTKIKEHVSPKTYAAALERGKELDLGETVHKLVSPVGFSLLT